MTIERVGATRAALVDDALRRLGTDRAVVLRGPAGIGKTAVVRSVVAALERRGVTTLRAVTSETAQRLPMGALAGLFSVPFAGEPAERLVAAVAAVRSARRDAVLVIDDAHLLDDESAAAVHHVAAARLLPVLATVRAEAPWPDAVRRLWRDELADLVDVPPLGRAECAEALARVLGGPADAATIERFRAASEGNPLLLRELAASTRSARLLRHVNGIWTADTLSGGTTVRALLDERVARLDDELRAVAELLAVGTSVPRRILVALTSPDALERAESATIARVRDADGLIEAGHQLLGDAVRRTLDPERAVELLGRLVAAATDDGPDAADLVVPVALWMLALEDRHAADPALLWAAADRSMDRLLLDLAEQLAEAALRAGGGDAARDLLTRIRANQGRPVERPATAAERRQQAQGMAEAFLIGLGPIDGVRAALASSAAELPDGPERAHVEALDLHVALTIGPATPAAVERMAELVRTHAGTTVGCVAAMRPAEVLGDQGRFEDALALVDEAELGRVPGNEFHRYRLGHSRALLLLRSGRPAEAAAVVVGRLGGSDTPTAVVHRSVVAVEVALAAGRPADAAREARQILAVLGAIDAAGLRTWSLAALGFAEAWAGHDAGDGDTVAGTDDVGPVPPQARPMVAPTALARAERLAALGHHGEAHAAALALVEQAERGDQWFWALRALHLAARLRPAAWMPERADALAARTQSEWARLLADHVATMVDADAAALEKVAAGFERVGQDALALAAYTGAADAHRAAAQRAGTTRCAAAATRLRTAGVAQGQLGPAGHGDLTLRERDIVTRAATGATNREIATALGLSTRTVETHLQRAYRKLGVNDRASLPAAPGGR